MIDDLLGLLLPIGLTIACLGGLAIVLWLCIRADSRAEAAFMQSCMNDHKQYECTAMWRAGETHTTVVPMPVIIPGK